MALQSGRTGFSNLSCTGCLPNALGLGAWVSSHMYSGIKPTSWVYCKKLNDTMCILGPRQFLSHDMKSVNANSFQLF